MDFYRTPSFMPVRILLPLLRFAEANLSVRMHEAVTSAMLPIPVRTNHFHPQPAVLSDRATTIRVRVDAEERFREGLQPTTFSFNVQLMKGRYSPLPTVSLSSIARTINIMIMQRRKMKNQLWVLILTVCISTY